MLVLAWLGFSRLHSWLIEVVVDHTIDAVSVVMLSVGQGIGRLVWHDIDMVDMGLQDALWLSPLVVLACAGCGRA